MSAPLTIEQMILNHNIGVSINDAKTLQGHQPSDFLPVGAKFDASVIITGTVATQRLPVATQTAAGIVQLSDNVNSNSSSVAASSAAVYAINQALGGKLDSNATFDPSVIKTGAFKVVLNALSSLSLNQGIIRNIFISDQVPTNAIGSDGDVYLLYQD